MKPLIKQQSAEHRKTLHSTLQMLIIVCVSVWSCATHTHPNTYTYRQKDGNEGHITLDRIHDSLYVLRHFTGNKQLSEWELPYPVYRFDCGDLTGNGWPEIAVGVIKPTRYFPQPDKRLFIFKLYKGRLIRPLWLGSRVGLPLSDFCVERSLSPARIHTTERKHDGTAVEALYRYEGFGLKFERYIP